MREAEEIIINDFLTVSEKRKLQEAVRRNGEIDEAEAEKAVKWAIKILCQYEYLKLLQEGWITIDGWDGEKPKLVPSSDALEFIGEVDFEPPMLEEMKCKTF